MIFSRKIYYNDKPLVLTTNLEAYLDTYPVAEMYQVLNGATAANFEIALQTLESNEVSGAIIEGQSEAHLLQQLKTLYTPIQAGGGLVFNEHNALLMIFRRGKWDLPKGKLDDGEDIATCALREVQEETGVGNLSMKEHLCDSYHIYPQDNIHYLKQTVWYIMNAPSNEILLPQKEENILEARWVGEKEIAFYAARSYEAIREVLKTAGCKW